MAARSACSWAAPAVEKRYRLSTLSQSVVAIVARTALVMRRSGAGASARDKKPSVLLKWVRSGSISAVGERLAVATEDVEPLRVAQGLLYWGGSKSKQVVLESHLNAGVAGLGDLHVPVRAQRLPNIAVQRVDDYLLATVTQLRVPRGGFVEQAAAVTVSSNRF